MKTGQFFRFSKNCVVQKARFLTNIQAYFVNHPINILADENFNNKKMPESKKRTKLDSNVYCVQRPKDFNSD